MNSSSFYDEIWPILSAKEGSKEFMLYRSEDGKWFAGIGNPSHYVMLGEVQAEIESDWFDRPEQALLQLYAKCVAAGARG